MWGSVPGVRLREDGAGSDWSQVRLLLEHDRGRQGTGGIGLISFVFIDLCKRRWTMTGFRVWI